MYLRQTILLAVGLLVAKGLLSDKKFPGSRARFSDKKLIVGTKARY